MTQVTSGSNQVFQVFEPDSAILQIMPGFFRAGFNNRLGISGLGQVKIGSDRVRFGTVFDLYEPGLGFYRAVLR